MKHARPPRPSAHRTALSLTLALAAGCGPSSMAGDAGDSGTSGPPTPPPMVCHSGQAWVAPRAIYRDATEAWGLTAARGVRTITGDVDNDGYMDLVVLPGGYNTRTNLEGPVGMRGAVFLNRPREDGGRRFVDATTMSNFFVTRDGSAGGRVVNLAGFADVDNDGDQDAYTGVYVQLGTGVPEDTGDRSELLLNDGMGHFTLAPASAITPPVETVPQTSGLAWVDYDRDGKLDAFVGYFYDPEARVEVGQQPNLFRGNGDGTFTDATEAAGLTLSNSMSAFAMAQQRRPLYGASACDVNGDGVLDLLGAAYGRQWNELFVSTPAGRYSEIGLVSGVGGDMNADYTYDQSYRCFCQLNPGMCPMDTPAPAFDCSPMNRLRGWQRGYNDQPWRLNGNTFAIACGDVDNDGDIDLYTADIAHPDTGPASDLSQLLVNGGQSGDQVRFTRPGRDATGLVVPNGNNVGNDEGGLAAAMWDFDQDGRLDVYLGTSDYDQQYGWLFHQNANGTFTELPRAAGFRHPCPTGFALADFDNDGDMDVIVGSSRARSWCAARWPNGNEVHIYENLSTDTNWTEIRLVGRGPGGANRDAIGARVRVTAGGVTQTREVSTSFGHFAQSQQAAVHFGLGTNCAIERIEVRWPDAAGTVETFTDVRANYRVEIRQGEGFARYPGT